jgi:microcystin-dependent protein
MEEYIGMIKIFAGNFAPRGWALCNGQLMSISQYSAVYAILGTMYGGDGISTFALPDLRGRAPIGFGQGPGLSNYAQGQIGGVEGVTLATTQIPSHSHPLNVNNAKAGVAVPTTSNSIAAPVDVNGDPANGFSQAAPNTQISPSSIGVTGGNQPHENRAPYVALNYIICLEGLFPQRN